MGRGGESDHHSSWEDNAASDSFVVKEAMIMIRLLLCTKYYEPPAESEVHIFIVKFIEKRLL